MHRSSVLTAKEFASTLSDVFSLSFGERVRGRGLAPEFTSHSEGIRINVE
jgi:hypothetical protein